MLHGFLWKKVLTQVFSYKQKTAEQLLWSSIIYTGWQWVLEIYFPPKLRFTVLFCLFCFPVRCSTLCIVSIKHLLDESLYLREYPLSFSPLSFLMMALLCFLTGAMNHVCVNRSLSKSACSQNSEGEQMMRCLRDEELLLSYCRLKNKETPNLLAWGNFSVRKGVWKDSRKAS